MSYYSMRTGACWAGGLVALSLGLCAATALAQHHGGSSGGPSGGHSFSAPSQSHTFSGPSNFSQGQGFSQQHVFSQGTGNVQSGMMAHPNNFSQQGGMGNAWTHAQQGVAGGTWTHQGNPGGNWTHHEHEGHHYFFNPYWGWGVGGWWGPELGTGWGYGYDPTLNGPYVASYGYTPDYVAQPALINPPPANAGQPALDGAIAAFKQGDYRGAIAQAQQVAAADSRNAAAHQLMSLALFATGDYRGSAAEMHTALTLGPPMDWPTIYSFYGDDKAYTAQLRALEQFAGANPQSPDAHFLLGFHYGATGNRDQAIPQLQQTVQLNANDQMATRLLNMLQAAPPAGAGEQGR